jgi:hypothetical protein
MRLGRLVLLAGAAAVAIAVALFALSGDDDDTISLEGVPNSELASRGIELFIPTGDPAITAQQAIDIGMRDRVSDNIREPALVRLVTVADPQTDTLAWAVVFDKKETHLPRLGGPYNPNPTPSPSPTPANCGPPQPYVVAFVNAATADNLLEFESERRSDLAPGETCPPTPIPPTPTLPPGARTAIELEGLPDDTFGPSVFLLAPNAGETPSISAQEAVGIALDRKEGAEVLETVFARLTQPTGVIDNLVWAVNLDPSTVFAQEPLGGNFCNVGDFHPEYSVIFVDALTADLVFSAQRSLLPPSADDGPCPSVAEEDKDYPSPTQVPGFATAQP